MQLSTTSRAPFEPVEQTKSLSLAIISPRLLLSLLQASVFASQCCPRVQCALASHSNRRGVPNINHSKCCLMNVRPETSTLAGPVS